jgi:hypothetical protein
MQHSWIDPTSAKEAHLTLEPVLEAPAFESALFPNQQFTPSYKTKAALRLHPFNFTIEVPLYLLPEATTPRQYDVLLGDTHCAQYDLLEFYNSTIPPYAKPDPVPEAEDDGDDLQDLDEINASIHADLPTPAEAAARIRSQGHLNPTLERFAHECNIFTQANTVKGDGVTPSTGTDVPLPHQERWKEKICDKNFPPGSTIRHRLEETLNVYYDKGVITNSLNGSRIIAEPMVATLKDGHKFMGNVANESQSVRRIFYIFFRTTRIF